MSYPADGGMLLFSSHNIMGKFNVKPFRQSNNPFKFPAIGIDNSQQQRIQTVKCLNVCLQTLRQNNNPFRLALGNILSTCLDYLNHNNRERLATMHIQTVKYLKYVHILAFAFSTMRASCPATACCKNLQRSYRDRCVPYHVQIL